jgi:hypothetical protein
MKFINKSKLKGEDLKRLLVTLKGIPSGIKMTMLNNAVVTIREVNYEKVFIIKDR